MASWGEFEAAAPELATAIRARFEAHLHHVLATLTRNGSPRVSGTEARFHDGDLWLGCMPGSVKAQDLGRDARFALHAAPIEVEMTEGDAKISGRVIEETDRQRLFDWLVAIGHGDDLESAADVDSDAVTAFVGNIESATLTKVATDHLDITTWTPADGLVVRRAG